MWKGVATQLRSTNHPIIVPDLLGYHGTDKPTDPAQYKWNAMTKDLIEIIDTEKADQVISVGHDWGSACASRLYNYYPDRVVGLILLNVGYMPPSREPFDLDANNKLTEQHFGYPFFSYWHLFTAEDGPAILKDNVERLYPLLHGKGETMKRFFTVPDAMREHLTNDDPSPEVRPYAQDQAFKEAFVTRMRRDGFDGPQCWYKAMVQQHQTDSDKNLPEGVDKVDVPVLYIGAKDDAVCRPEGMFFAIQAGLLPKLEQADTLDAAHWTPYEKPEEVAKFIEVWLGKNFAK